MKKVSILLAMAVLASLMLVPAVSAQGITYTSGFQVQNLESTTASITIAYYNQDGTKPISDVTGTIAGMGSVNYFPIAAPDGFNGSVVVSSDKKIVAIANTLGNSSQYAASTEGFDAGATEVKLPLIMRGNAGYYTWFNVQNVGASPASVTVHYVPGSSGTDYTAAAVTIQPNAAATFSQRDLTALGSKFVGSAVVSSNQPIVATVMQVGEASKNMMGYNGFTAGATKVSLPLIAAKNGPYFTGYQVQNVGSGTATVSVAYGPNTGGSLAPAGESFSLAPNQSQTFIQSGGKWSDKYIGSATITSDQPVVAVVNQITSYGIAMGTAYNGFDANAATNKVSAPLVVANNAGYFTGIQVMNVGTAAATVTLSYSSQPSFSPTAETQTINAGSSYTWIQSGGQWTGHTYVGSASIEAGSGAKIVAIVNYIWPGASGDQFMTYNGFNY